MLTRDAYPPGVPCWIDTAQPDTEAAVAFYGGLFGWELEDMAPPDASGSYWIARLEGHDVAAIASRQDGPPVWNTYICVESADDAAAKVAAAGGTVAAGPFDVHEAGRMAECADPAGAQFCVWEPRNRKGAHVVNEPGTWNWSNLATHDPERARKFYAAVFGWEADGEMLRLPGYGEFLMQRDPELRRRQAEAGAPAGFEDAIGFVNPAADDQKARWSVTFAVDDADAVGDRAAELGGEVVVPPFDAPWVRSAVLEDPQGAEFTVNKFVPE